MKRYLFLAVAALIGASTFAAGVSPVIDSAAKQRYIYECARAPLLAKEWKEHSLGAADILSVTNKYTYDGTAKTPTPVVKMRGTNITAGTDFDFAYANNTNAGWAVVKVIAKKFDYYGGQSSKFYIAPKTLTSSMVSNIVDQAYTGSPICPMPVVVDGSTALTPVKDFAVFWSNNIRATTNAACRIVGNGNYSGAVDTTFKIVEE